MTFKMLDCFCGMGGVSDGFAQAMAEQWGNFKPLQTVLLE